MLADAVNYSIAPYAGGHVVVDDARGGAGEVLVCEECGAISVQSRTLSGHRCPVCMAMVEHAGPERTAAEAASAMGVPIASAEDMRAEFDALYLDIADFESAMNESVIGKLF